MPDNNNNNSRLEENNNDDDDDDDVPHWLSQVRISKHSWHFSFFCKYISNVKKYKIEALHGIVDRMLSTDWGLSKFECWYRW